MRWGLRLGCVLYHLKDQHSKHPSSVAQMLAFLLKASPSDKVVSGYCIRGLVFRTVDSNCDGLGETILPLDELWRV